MPLASLTMIVKCLAWVLVTVGGYVILFRQKESKSLWAKRLYYLLMRMCNHVTPCYGPDYLSTPEFLPAGVWHRATNNFDSIMHVLQSIPNIDFRTLLWAFILFAMMLACSLKVIKQMHLYQKLNCVALRDMVLSSIVTLFTCLAKRVNGCVW